jgi:hypothetical protein
MFSLFIEGGVLFMSILTIIALFVFSVAIINAIPIFTNKVADVGITRHKLGYIKSLGLLALVFGLLGQLIGLYAAFQAIEAMGEIPPAMLASGLKVSSISSLYGMIIFILAYLIWFLLDTSLTKSSK